MKILILFISACLLSVNSLRADVIYTPYHEFNLALSGEFIWSREFSLTSFNTLEFWGGAGLVTRSFQSFNPSIGGEFALEMRQYFRRNTYQGLNLGIYIGYALMSHYRISHADLHHAGFSDGLVPGLKICYKKTWKSGLTGEPYAGISNVFHRELPVDPLNPAGFENNGLVLTIGVRIGLNKVINLNNK